MGRYWINDAQHKGGNTAFATLPCAKWGRRRSTALQHLQTAVAVVRLYAAMHPNGLPSKTCCHSGRTTQSATPSCSSSTPTSSVGTRQAGVFRTGTCPGTMAIVDENLEVFGHALATRCKAEIARCTQQAVRRIIALAG